MTIRGKAIKYGDDVNTDVIIPGKYLSIADPEKMAKHVMKGLDPDFLKKFTKGDVIVAGKNFGCGSSREQAAMCLKYVGVGAIVAKSFSRIFYRNSINQGIIVIESPDFIDQTKMGDELEIDLKKEVVKNITRNLEFKVQSPPEFIKEIINAGGLVPSLKKKLKI